MAVSTTTAPELTAEQVQTVLVKPLEAASTFLASGVRIVDTAGPLRLPKLGAATSPAWFAENALITPEVDPTFDEVALLPSTIKSVKTLTRFSNELARQSVISLDAALKERLVKDVADTIDAQFWSASNGATATMPKGILNYAGQSITSVGALTLDHLLDAEALALAANVNPANLKWAMTSRELTALRKVKQGTGSNQYVLQPDPTRAGGYVIFGKPVIVTNRLPDTTGAPDTGNLVLADFSQIVVARDQNPTVKLLDQTFGDYDQMALRVTARYDVAPLNDDAIVKLTGITV
ncbi:phage major capsid protein [Ornithinimicrobium ciconiae]|uniref:Phage major capsid protein n=1 Tax=Ornithinimicrobium ciconiae TaxID=2594265 RepID=A0A516G9Y5_9MICO|nr:phage major capsid protein [Ornithinimicrobium ciconiae]QDO88347.1 phage major capsid protein [Ornithinimicrobium ciconiae]